ncbi:hypothetical protein FB567DRAFT_539025 [Paraphoma chrysanthemicola]|uniref:Wax synthase domain-containing protein n=1 Tax=Paraphoma chrysanthemicola TaxID=798071 RepID=A0A8K0QW26_9PLEO|nr:hypothetical protein FB567DRAFT_539025 [Paraphoma chrysanthemicola]
MRITFTELKGLYFELVTTIVPGPASWSYFVPLLLLPLGLLVPPSILNHGQLCAVILPINIAATIHAWLTLGGNDVISTDALYMTLFLYLFKDPRSDFKRVIRSGSREGREKQDAPLSNGSKKDERIEESRPVALESYPDNFIGRFTWAMMLPQSRPMQDWIIGELGHDRRVLRPFDHPTRFKFLMDIFSRLLPVLLLFLPLSKQLAAHDPYFSDPTWSISGPYPSGRSDTGKIVTLLRTFVPSFILRPVVMAMYAYSLLLGLFLPPMLFVLLLNALRLIPDNWSPHTWHPHFGPFSAIAKYGLRGFWGRWWHQQMRHIVSEPGRRLASKLRLKDDGWQKTAKYMLICISAFTLSGFTHSGMVPAKPRFATVGVNELRLSLAGFFWSQPCGIAVELFLLEPALRRLPSSMRELQAPLRIVWTMVFMCFACTFLVLPFGQLRYWDIFPSW